MPPVVGRVKKMDSCPLLSQGQALRRNDRMFENLTAFGGIFVPLAFRQQKQKMRTGRPRYILL